MTATTISLKKDDVLEEFLGRNYNFICPSCERKLVLRLNDDTEKGFKCMNVYCKAYDYWIYHLTNDKLRFFDVKQHLWIAMGTWHVGKEIPGQKI